MSWEILLTSQVEFFLDELFETDRASHRLVNQAILILERNGPSEGRPLVDSITASVVTNLKELRPPSGGQRETEDGNERCEALAGHRSPGACRGDGRR